MLNALLNSGLALLLSIGSAAAASSSASVSARPDAPASASAAEVVGALNQCMQSCAATPSLRTNKHTCALTCEVVADTAIDALTPEQAFQADATLTWRDACFASCEGDSSLSRNDKQTCLLTCADTSEALCGTWAPPLRADDSMHAARALGGR